MDVGWLDGWQDTRLWLGRSPCRLMMKCILMPWRPDSLQKSNMTGQDYDPGEFRPPMCKDRDEGLPEKGKIGILGVL
jgi:hypothetical protein